MEDNATGTLSVRLLLDGERAGTVRMKLAHPAQGVLFDGEPELYQVTLTLLVYQTIT